MRVWRASLELILCLPLVVGSASAAAPKVDLVISGEASSLEKQAAAEIAADLQKNFRSSSDHFLGRT